MTQPQPTALAAIQKARLLAVQTKFFNKVFSQGNGGIAPAQLTMEFRQIMQLAGIPIPKAGLVTLDTVQVILAGGAVVSDFDKGAGLLQCVGDIGSGISGVIQLLADLGIGGEAMKQGADFAGLGTSAAMALASGGANILADLGVVLGLISVVGDLGRDFAGSKDAAIAEAKKNLAKQVKSFVSAQVQYATTQMSLYNSGKLNYFDFVGNIALNAPLEFPGFFPKIASYAPSWVTVNFVGNGESDGLFSNQYDTERASIREMFFTRQSITKDLLDLFFNNPMKSFSQFFQTTPTISIHAVSMLSMLLHTGTSGDTTIGFNFDILTAMKALGLTPSILGDDWLFKGFMKEENDLTNWKSTLTYAPLTLKWYRKPQPAGVVINGKPSYTSSQQADIANFKQLGNLQLYMQHLDEIGDIDSLMQIPEAVAMLKRWAVVYIDPIFSSSGTVTNMKVKPGKAGVQRQSWFNAYSPMSDPRTMQYIRANYLVDLSDYWKCLSMLKQMIGSNLLRDPASAIQSHYETIDHLTEAFQGVYSWTLAKNLNVIARQNMSQSLGIPVESLASRVDTQGNRIFYRKVG